MILLALQNNSSVYTNNLTKIPNTVPILCYLNEITTFILLVYKFYL